MTHEGGHIVADGKMGFWSVAAIGVGGMVGGGIFAVLGLSVQMARGGTPVAFAMAGAVALLTATSYSRLSVRFPCRGGTVEFLNQAFGKNTATGSLNVLLWLSYVVMLALYAYAFGAYGAAFFPDQYHETARHLLISAAIVVPTLLNVANASIIGKTESAVVALKLTILLLFLLAGAHGVDGSRLAPAAWVPPLPLIAGGMLIFVAYEGFELMANTGEDVTHPEKVLPRAFYASVLFVIALYVLIAVVAVGSLDADTIISAKDYALAEAARPFLGQTGFSIIAVAAMLSTFSAINATLYGSARLTYIIAKEEELPEMLERQIWGQPLEGLFITSALALLLANIGRVESISTLGSSGFLVVFAAVNAASIKVTDSNMHRGFGIAGLLGCVFALGVLLWQSLHDDLSKIWILAGLFGGALFLELAYRLAGTKGPRKTQP